MDGKTVFLFIVIFDVFLILGIIWFAVHYSYWLLWLLLPCVGISSETKNKLLK
jgi:hypothetical protein